MDYTLESAIRYRAKEQAAKEFGVKKYNVTINSLGHVVMYLETEDKSKSGLNLADSTVEDIIVDFNRLVETIQAELITKLVDAI